MQPELQSNYEIFCQKLLMAFLLSTELDTSNITSHR